jgi:hypothetical protein
MQYIWTKSFTVHGLDKIVYIDFDTDMAWTMVRAKLPHIGEREFTNNELIKIVDSAYERSMDEILAFFEQNPGQSTYQLCIQGSDVISYLMLKELSG